jgi:signal transduction histidine kinase
MRFFDKIISRTDIISPVKGVTKRWILNSLVFALPILAVSVFVFANVIKKYFYNSIYQMIYAESCSLYNTFTGGALESTLSFREAALDYIRFYTSKDTVKVSIFDENNKVLYSTSDNALKNISEMPDFVQAIQHSDNFGLFIGAFPHEGKIMAETRCLYTESGKFLGSVRYSASLLETDKTIFFGIVVLSVLCTVVIFLIVTLGVYFLKSIINPVIKISDIAKNIASGNFNITIVKKYDDEIGGLCDAINYMAERLSSAEKVKNDFISSISHELRTPLTAIKGWAETIQTGTYADKEMTERGLEIIVHETERLSGIVEELLDLSRLQSGKFSVIMDKIDVLAELSEAVYMFKERAVNENKTLTYSEPKTLSPIMGDKNRLKQVFINIIDNALKYTESGAGISVSVKEDAGSITIGITDNGCGIAKTHIDRVTEKFYKANSLKRGSGIGLAIVDEIIKVHRGALEIISEENIGTTVSVRLPVAQ